MNQVLIDKIVEALLYEGYILYPYRRSTKNQSRWTFGCLFPRAYSEGTGGEPCSMQTECLLRGNDQTKVSVQIRFLQLVDRVPGRCDQGTDSFVAVDELGIAGKRYQKWQEAVERTVVLDAELAKGMSRVNFQFPGESLVEPLRDEEGKTAAALTRTSEAIQGSVELESTAERDDVYRLTVRISNLSPMGRMDATRDQAQVQSMASTHAVLSTSDGHFISLIDPPPNLVDSAHSCKQVGCWPVLVGEPGESDSMLVSPIILYDYPQLAPESPGDLFDGTEIDEILSLRVMTLGDDEKRSAADLDPRAAAMINRTESLAREQLARLHGTMRQPRKVQAVHIGNAEVRAGDRVRLAPRGRADAFDIILNGKTATIVAIEQDYENRIHLAVTIDDDPGAYLGAAGKIGHRFFFRPDEVEPIPAE